jgi:beta-galactosidase
MPQVTGWYGAITASHSGVDVIQPGADLTAYKIVFAPVAYVLSEAQATRIRNFVQAGGVFVSSFRLGVKTESSQIVRTPLPGLLRDVMGVTVEDYLPIYSAKQGVKFSSAFAGADAECGLWADILQPAGAEVVGSYTAGEHAGKAAVTINTFGKGRAVYVGADLDAASLAKVLRTLTASAGVRPAIDVPAGVEMTVRRSGDKQWMFLLNHTSIAQTVTIAKPITDLLTKQALSGTIELTGYGVRVLA